MSMFGVYIATVLDDKPENNMLKIKLDTSGSERKARLAVPFASADGKYGFFFLPNNGDKVLVAFEGGDENSPIIIGSMLSSLSSDMGNKISLKAPEIYLN